MNGGGPGQSTQTLVLKVYLDGVVNANIGSSSAQSVVLMAGVIVLCALQFRFLGRKAAHVMRRRMLRCSPTPS